jgi:SAM-dependent methyltransferase
MSSSDHVAANRELWTRSNAEYTNADAAKQWAADEIAWGVWGISERELRVLPDDLVGLDVLDLGCGTGYFCAWLARRGARPVGVDVTPAQLETARRCQREFGLEFPLLQASAEDVPLPSGSFDVVLSEYGASIWCDPVRWLAEATRLLRPSGRLVFLRNSTLSMLCAPDDANGQTQERLLRPQFGSYRYEWAEGGIEFHPPHGELIRLLREHGFEIEDLLELQAPADAETHPYYSYVTAEWAQRWPAEEIWKARKRA